MVYLFHFLGVSFWLPWTRRWGCGGRALCRGSLLQFRLVYVGQVFLYGGINYRDQEIQYHNG